MNCHVIACNDCIECVVLGTEEQIARKMDERRAEYERLNSHVNPDILYWHTREVPLFIESPAIYPQLQDAYERIGRRPPEHSS